MELTVKVPDFERLEAKLGHALEQAAEVNQVVEDVGVRLGRPGKGLGERRNALLHQRVMAGKLLSHRISFERTHHPRRTGRAKHDSMHRAFVNMAPLKLQAAVARMAQRFSE